MYKIFKELLNTKYVLSNVSLSLYHYITVRLLDVYKVHHMYYNMKMASGKNGNNKRSHGLVVSALTGNNECPVFDSQFYQQNNKLH